MHVDHYSDNFSVYCAPESDQCTRQLQLTLEICERLGVPLASEKLEGSTNCLTFLSIEIDTTMGVIHSSPGKLA